MAATMIGAGPPGRSQHTRFTAAETPLAGFNADAFHEVLCGQTALLEITEFLSDDVIDDIVRRINNIVLDAYDAALVTPIVQMFGISVFNRYDNLAAINTDSARVNPVFNRHFDVDPRVLALDVFSAATGITTSPLPLPGVEPIVPGVIRDLSAGALLHFDHLTTEAPDLEVPAISSVVSMNVYIEMGDGGGAVNVYDHPHRDSDQVFRDRYGFHPGVVAFDQYVSVRPKVGSAVLFRPANLHSVDPVTAGRRLTLSYFIGLCVDGSVVVWS